MFYCGDSLFNISGNYPNLHLSESKILKKKKKEKKENDLTKINNIFYLKPMLFIS